MAENGHVSQGDIASLLELFEDAKTFGSLIQVPPKLAAKLPEIEQRLRRRAEARRSDARSGARHVAAASSRLDCSLGSTMRGRQPAVHGQQVLSPDAQGLRGRSTTRRPRPTCTPASSNATFDFAKPNGFVGMITIPNWMFLSSFEECGRRCLTHQTIDSFIHNGRGVFGSDFGSCSFVHSQCIVSQHIKDLSTAF